LTPQDHRRKLPATFPQVSGPGDRSGSRLRTAPKASRKRSPRAENAAPHSRGGIKRAVFAGMDCAMHQSGVRGPGPLAAGSRFRGRTVQQLQRSASQRTTTHQPATADASAIARKLPSTGTLAGPTAVIAASEPKGRSSRPCRDEPSPQNAYCVRIVFLRLPMMCVAQRLFAVRFLQVSAKAVAGLDPSGE
jgi:hypothetical protein